jgi:hypothetical protein
MSDDNAEFFAQAKDEYDMLTKRIYWAQDQVIHYTNARDEVVAKVRAKQRKDGDTAEIFHVSRARIGQMLRRWRQRHAS